MRGLTLVEALLALAAMALMALITTRSIDSMLLSQWRSQQGGATLSGLEIGLSQWTRDLDQVRRTPYLSAVHWNGRVLRLVRRSANEEALQVVAWSADGATWQRWQSGPLRTRAGLIAAWQDAGTARAAAASTEPGTRARSELDATPGAGSSAVLLEAARWQVQFWEAGRWAVAPAQPDLADEAAGGRIVETPAAVRLLLHWHTPQGQPRSLVLDWLERSRP